MAFGQQAGPPASAKQVQEITELLEQAGYASFREARHMVGLTQRQVAGKFTQGEAVELIERLQSASEDADVEPDRVASPPSVGRGAVDRGARRQADRQAEVLAAAPADDLADELVRRGWVCMPPV